MKRFLSAPVMRSLNILCILCCLYSCTLFNHDTTPDEDDEKNPINMDAYANQAQQMLTEVWEQTTPIKSTITDTTAITIETTEMGPVSCKINHQPRPVITVNFGNFRSEPYNIVRSGKISMTLTQGTHIAEKYSVAEFLYDNFTVTDLKTGQYIVYNGKRALTNLSGGVLTNLTYGQPELVQRVRAYNFHIYYSGSSGDIIENTARLKRMTKLGPALQYQMITTGDTTLQAYHHVADWGTLRNGKTYYHIIKEPIVYKSCGRACRYVDGLRIRKIIDGRETWTHFGVTKKGQPNPGCDAFGKLVYYFNAKGDSVATVVKE